MKDFPKFMKSEVNKIPQDKQNTRDIEGYFFNGSDDSQIAYWTSHSEQVSRKHINNFDEYMVCVSGEYTAFIEGKTILLNPGDELFIPKGKEQWGKCIEGTRTIHVFGG